MRGHPNFELQFDSPVVGVTQDASGVEITIDRDGRTERRSGRYLVGADGASSKVRRALGVEFEGFTWPDRLLVASTPFGFRGVIPGLTPVNYVADPERWYFLLQIPGVWRVMFLVNEDASDERVQTREFAQSLMAGVVPGISNYPIEHSTLYKVHQRVAKTFEPGISHRRRCPHQQSARWHGNEWRHPRCRHSRRAACGRVAWRGARCRTRSL